MTGLPPPVPVEEETKPLTKTEQKALKREQAVLEIVSTEDTYCRLLSKLMDHYVQPLANYKLITEEQYKMLFPQLEIIKGLSDKLLADMKERRKDWDPKSTKLSDLFNNFIPFFRMYQGYVNNYDRAVGLVRKLENKQKWVEYSKAVRSSCEGFDLPSLLILPVQRIPRYKLLLSEVLKNTSTDHPDYASLNKTLEEVKKVSLEINDKMKEFDRREKVKKIESKFIGKLQLLAPARHFLKEGQLWKVCRNKDRIYKFFLFSDLLLYASSRGNKLSLHNLLTIDMAFSVEWLKDSKYNRIEGRAFRIITSKKSFVVFGDTPKIAKEWYDTLDETIQKHKNSLKSNENENVQAVAVWVPDDHHDKCTISGCNTQFTFLNRRHHCRTCGALCCGKCSKYKLKNSEGVLQRACKLCYAKHNDGNTDKNNDDNDDDSSDDEYQEELNALHNISYYIDSDNYTPEDIFLKLGRGVGSYMIIPTTQNENMSQYLVDLVVYTSNGTYNTYKIGIVNKSKGCQFRLKLKNKKKDFQDMKSLLEHLGKKEKQVFSYGIQRQDVIELVNKNNFYDNNNETNNIEKITNKSKRNDINNNNTNDNSTNNKNNNFIKGIENYPKAKALFDYEAEVLGDLSLKAGDIIVVTEKEGDEGWWFGICGNKQGLFPSTYVEMIENKKLPTGKHEPKLGDILVARFDYNDGGQEELSFKIGDKIELIDKHDSGWWLGRLEESKAVGWFAPDLVTPQQFLTTTNNSKIKSSKNGSNNNNSNNDNNNSVNNSVNNSNTTTTTNNNNISLESGDSVGGFRIITLLNLKNKSDIKGCDVQKLEAYLSIEEFKSTFDMTYDEFKKLPPWRQIRLKKSACLF